LGYFILVYLVGYVVGLSLVGFSWLCNWFILSLVCLSWLV